jgi:hypothetical protein
MMIAIAAALLGSLHALDYDAAILAPFGVAAAGRRSWLAAPYVVALVFPPTLLTPLLFIATALLEACWAPSWVSKAKATSTPH